MPARPAILALLVAIALAVGSIWLLAPPPPEADRVPRSLLEVDAAAITALELSRPGGAAARIERGPLGWSMAGGTYPWAIDETRARAATRILADLRGRPLADAEEEPPPVAATITLGDAAGRSFAIGVREPVVGGRRVVDLSMDGAPAERFVVDEPLYELFAVSGLDAWRVPLALAGLPGRPSRVALESASGRLEFARVDGRWALRTPVAVRADEAAVDALLASLAELRIERFELPPPEGEASARITLETDAVDRSGGEPTRLVERLAIALHGAADTTGTRLVAGLGRTREVRAAGAEPVDLGAATVAVDAAPLATISLAPRAFVARTALDGDASLVAALTVGGVRYERTSAGWAPSGEADDDAAAPPGALETVARLLAEAPATRVLMPDQSPPEGRLIGSVVVSAEDAGGTTISPVGGIRAIVLEPSGGDALVLLQSEGVTRQHSGNAAAAIRWAIDEDG
ncbi:MAG: hypothetical protein AAFX79_00465 [Planctomycetota bacterium]